MIDKYTENKIKDAVNIVDVFTELGFRLKKGQGGNWYTLCPYHQDRHLGSFVINERLNRFTCFACDASGDAFTLLKDQEGLAYGDSLRWCASLYNIPIDGEQKYEHKTYTPRPRPKELPLLELPQDMMLNTLHTGNDTLCNWMRSLPWNDEQRDRLEKVLRFYAVGHFSAQDTYDKSKQHEWTTFWHIDETGKVRTGKMMKFLSDGHRDKSKLPNGRDAYTKDWVHSFLDRKKDENGNKLYDLSGYDIKKCLFGMHLAVMPLYADATINIVESEKTALICATAYGHLDKHLWIATGGMRNLTPEKLQPLIEQGRTIVCYPDKDGVQTWKDRVKLINYEHLTIDMKVMDKYWLPIDGEKADIADVIVRMMKGTPSVLKQMMADNPNIATLVEKLELKEV